MHDVVIQQGHCYRRRGATGTAGHRGTEQEFASLVGQAMRAFLRERGVDAVTVLADDPIPDCRVFVALHQDGATSGAVRGASVGYRESSWLWSKIRGWLGGDTAAQSRELAQKWKALYSLIGWPSGFRPDNYTRALRNYYGFRKVRAAVKVLLEHGFATNRADCDWMWDHLDLIAETNSRAVMLALGHTTFTPNQEDAMGIRFEVHTDPKAKKTWAMYGSIEEPTVDLYGTHIPGAGEESPGGFYIVRDAVKAGRMHQVGDQKF